MTQISADKKRRGTFLSPAMSFEWGTRLRQRSAAWWGQECPPPLTPVPAKPDAFAFLAIFARGHYSPLSVLSVSSVVDFGGMGFTFFG